MKRIICSILVLSLALSTLYGTAQAAQPSLSSRVISTALSQIDYEEGPRSYSKYGGWYGYPNGHWCDMFVSWCANQVGISKTAFPWEAACTAHARLFDQDGAYYPSAARGGSYVPQQGDVIFFYDYTKYPKGNVLRHVGLGLWVENGDVFTIEGNTLTYRLDYSHFETVFPLINAKLQPSDYVAVKHYPLDEKQIHGYGVPQYTDRTVLPHNGWVDLGKYESLRGAFNTLDAQGIMPATSSYTYSPRYGMTRGDFLTAMMKLFGLSGWEADTEPFADFLEGSACYDAVMAARSAGIVSGTGSNQFKPNTYVSAPAAQAIISRTLAYVGQADQQFSFSPGDFSYMLTPYTIRADIARALYTLLSQMPTPKVPLDQLSLNGELLDWPMLRVNGSTYVPLEAVQQVFPALEIAETDGGTSVEDAHLPVPMDNTDRMFLSTLFLQNGGDPAEVASFCYHGTQYVMLRPAADLLGLAVQWQAGSGVIELLQEDPAA